MLVLYYDREGYQPGLLMLQRVGIRDEESHSEVQIKGGHKTCRDDRIVNNRPISIINKTTTIFSAVMPLVLAFKRFRNLNTKLDTFYLLLEGLLWL